MKSHFSTTRPSRVGVTSFYFRLEIPDTYEYLTMFRSILHFKIYFRDTFFWFLLRFNLPN